MRLTETMTVEWDGACYVLTEAVPVKRRKGGEGEREVRRYYSSLAGACQRAVELAGRDAPDLTAAIAAMRAMAAAVKAACKESANG